MLSAMSLVLSMTLCFVPKFKAQFESVKEAQAGIGRDTVAGSLWSRLRCALACFSVMITWLLENAIETADSKKGKGYGLKGRTAPSILLRTGIKRRCFGLPSAGFICLATAFQKDCFGGISLVYGEC